ncbi:MAG: Hsp20/alpha crystallin family protein [Deferrisomatales bacterium]|nr:Hsp20/alpha crystallin family protein [Deferrisomatales bacterium]
MTRIPRDILERLEYFQQEAEALFLRLFDEDLGSVALEDKALVPPVDVIETEEEILVRADLPGVDRDTLELYGGPNFLIIRGSKHPETERSVYLRIERSFGPFQRLIVLPAAGDPARSRARCEGGVLEIRIPRVADRRVSHRQIPIE